MPNRPILSIELSPIAVYSINEYLRATSLITQRSHKFNRSRWLYVTHYAVVGCDCSAHHNHVLVVSVRDMHKSTDTYTIELGATIGHQ